MTHDELLDFLQEHEEYWTSLRANRWDKVPAFNALRAVVELHKPTNGHDRNICLTCSPEILMPYPCPTIQAIEKELL